MRRELLLIGDRLRLLSEKHHLIEEAAEGYSLCYKNARETFPYPPDIVEMRFWQQSLYFQPGVRIRLWPYISTTMEMIVHENVFGFYKRITLLDGTVDDDYLQWEEPCFYELPDDEGCTGPIMPLDDVRGIPEEWRDIFPILAQLAQQQRLLERAE